MKRPPTVEQTAHVVRDVVGLDPRVLAAFLHGSMLHGSFRKDSDIDIALLLESGAEMPALERMRLEADLSARLGHRVDLGLLTFRNLVYFTQVIAKGEHIFCRDEAQTNRLLGMALSLYAALREERREIEAAYAA